MRVLSVDSSLGTEVAVLDAAADATADTAAGASQGAGSESSLSSFRVLATRRQDDARRHAESLGPMLAAVLGDPQVVGQPLDLVVVATGPAPFTGLRAGIVAARSVGRARGVPVLGVPSPDAVARAALDQLRPPGGPAGSAGAGSGGGPVVLVVTDARRKEVYAARYRASGTHDVTRLDPLTVCAPDRALDLGPSDAVAGSGTALYPGVYAGSPSGVAQGSRPLAPVSGDCRAQVRLALCRRARGERLPTEPAYLRHADVQVPAGPGAGRPVRPRGAR